MNRHQRRRQTDNLLANKAITEIKNEARTEGMMIATSIMFIALKDKWGFSSTPNGKGRLDQLIDILGEEFDKMDQDATQFCFEYYVKILEERTGIKISKN